jgi:hypothetical protein
VLRALELTAYRELPAHAPGWIAARLAIPEAEESRCLATLAAAGQIRWDGDRWTVEGPLAVDTRRDPAAGRRLKGWWARAGVDALEAGSDGLSSYNVFTVSEADFARLRELHAAYFRQLRSVVSASTPGERVVVANLQLFGLDPGVGGRRDPVDAGPADARPGSRRACPAGRGDPEPDRKSV